MSETEVQGSLAAAPAAKQRGLQVLRPGRYFGWLLIVLLVPYLLAFFLVRLPSYENWSASQWGPFLEYGFEAHPKAADVVIFGDSSAFLGIDPRLINARLGLNTIVLPDTIGSIPVTGDEPLRAYLKHNPAPRYIVLYFSPWNLDFFNLSNVRLFEGEEMMLRHMRSDQIASFARKKPMELLEFPFRLYSTFSLRMLRSLHHPNRKLQAETSLGHVDYTEPFAPLDNECAIPDVYLDRRGTASIEALMQRYSTLQTRVIVYLAPVPACRNLAAIAGRSFAKLQASSPVLLPARSFAGDPYYAHILPAFVPLASATFSDVLGARLQNQGNALGETGTSSQLSEQQRPRQTERGEMHPDT